MSNKIYGNQTGKKNQFKIEQKLVWFFVLCIVSGTKMKTIIKQRNSQQLMKQPVTCVYTTFTNADFLYLHNAAIHLTNRNKVTKRSPLITEEDFNVENKSDKID